MYQCTLHFIIASSKQRQSLRKAIAQDKKRISEIVAHYNSVIEDLQPMQSLLTTEEVATGRFPWSALSGIIDGENHAP